MTTGATSRAESRAADCLAGGGAMGALMRATDWSATALGPVESWPQSLRTTISIMLESKFAMVVAWGPEYRFFYNDRYRPVLGDKHPASLGMPGAEIFPEVWGVVGPEFDRAWSGDAFAIDDWLLPLERSGYLESCWFTVSYSPIRVESGGVGGVLAVVAETTERVEGERRLVTLRDLARRAGETHAIEQACTTAAEVFAQNPIDVPFALLYLTDSDGLTAQRVAAVGLTPDHPAAAARVALAPDARDGAGWPLASVLASGEMRVVDDLAARFGVCPGGAWPEPAHTAVLYPLDRPGLDRPYGVLVAGVSPRRRLDDAYRGFFELAAEHITTAVSNAHAFEAERRRAEALAEIDRAKTAFFSNVSHEFRTPLTLLLGPLDDALRRDALSADDRESIDVAHRNALRLLKLVNTLLEFSRIEAERVDASYEPTDLAALTAELASVFRSAAESAGLELRVECAPLPEPVYVDREMWEKIVLNLLSNALKFTFEGGIGVELAARGGAVELRVRDSGIGIPAAELPNMFARFHRIRGARSRTHEGTGIGLALVRELVRLHGGEISVDSAEGSGTTFTVRIPFGSAHLPQEQIRSAAGVRAAGSLFDTYLGDVESWVGAPVVRSAAAETSKISAGHILVADDNADMREYVARLLEPQWSVETAADGVDALERLRARKPDLVLTDVMMPRMSGFELLQRIRQEPALADVPVILLSARAGEESKVEGLDAGADDYLIKPFAAAELLARVRSHVNLARQRRELRAEVDAANERTRNILGSITDAFTFVDRDWIIRRVNPQAEKILGFSARELIGANLWQRFPELAGSPFEAPYLEAMTDGAAQRVEAYLAPLGKWLEVNVYPSADGLSLLYRDVTERVRTAETLRESESRHRRMAVDLEVANRAKDEFLTTLSHELRTPMTATLGWASLLRVGNFGEGNWKLAADAIEQSTRAQARLIDDILDVSRISTGKLQLSLAPVSLEEVVETAVATIRQMAEAKSQTIDLRIHKLDGCVIADADRLGQVIRNLLSNAAKFTPAGGRIEVEVDDVRRILARVRVTDTGDGIAPDFLPFVFDRFRQAEGGLRRVHGGLGLGLSIVKNLVELHGGHVAAESAGIGKGSTFTVTLPLALSASADVPANANESIPVAALAGVPVLVLEDDPATRLMLATALGAFGASVSATDSADEAMRILAARRCVVISDLAMPLEDGYAFVGRLRAAEDGMPRVPVIALTANARNEDRDRAIGAGFDSYLAKPIDIHDLAREIRRLAEGL